MERYSYSPYGDLTVHAPNGNVRTASTQSTRYTYTGREHDPTLNFFHFRARLYDAIVGRFSGWDLERYSEGNNLYTSKMSLSLLDPSGERIELPTRDPDYIWFPGHQWSDRLNPFALRGKGWQHRVRNFFVFDGTCRIVGFFDPSGELIDGLCQLECRGDIEQYAQLRFDPRPNRPYQSTWYRDYIVSPWINMGLIGPLWRNFGPTFSCSCSEEALHAGKPYSGQTVFDSEVDFFDW